MAESYPNDTIGPSDNPIEQQRFQPLGSGQLEIVRALSTMNTQGANVVHVHIHQHHSTVVKGDVVQGSKTDVNNSAIETLLAPSGDSSLQAQSQSKAIAEPSIQYALPWTDGEEQGAGRVPTGESSPQGHSQLQALPEPLIQEASTWADGEEQETEGPQQRAQLLSGQRSHLQDQREKFLTMETLTEDCSRQGQSQSQAIAEPSIQDALPLTDGEEQRAGGESDDKMGGKIERTSETISSPRMRMSVKRAVTEDCSLQGQFQSRAIAEPPIQDALPLTDGEEQGAGGESDDKMGEKIERTSETISSPRMRMSVKRVQSLQTFEEKSQTDEISNRKQLPRTNDESRFDTAAQTDNPRTRDQKIQTDVYVIDSDSQTFSVISQRSNAYAQTVNKVFSNTHVQTEILEQSTNQTQIEIKSYQKNEFRTEKVVTLDAISQTNEQALPHSAASALEMNKLYENEKTKQDVGDFLPLLETTWKYLQAKINLKSIETQLVHEMGDLYKIGEQFLSENNLIHAVVSFYATANLHRISDKTYKNLGEIEKSIEKYKMSLNAYEEAKDWPSDKKKTDSIARAENNLKNAEAKLRK